MGMYPGMGPYTTAMPPAAAYPPSPILNPSLAPTAGFSVPSSSNSSRQTSLSEPLPRPPARDRRSSASSACADLNLLDKLWRSSPPRHLTPDHRLALSDLYKLDAAHALRKRFLQVSDCEEMTLLVQVRQEVCQRRSPSLNERRRRRLMRLSETPHDGLHRHALAAHMTAGDSPHEIALLASGPAVGP
jgi:hypothetical protein